MASVALLDTSVATANLGDRVIVSSLVRQVPELAGLPRAATQFWPSWDTQRVIRRSDNLVFTGTNVLTPKLYRRRQWPSLTLLNQALAGKVWYAGIGWGTDAPQLDKITVALVRRTMPEGSTLGVRDSLTYERACASGLPSTYIGCPTMWGLKEVLPSWNNVSEVVTTLTDYNPDVASDQSMLDELGRRFGRVYFWPQGARDLVYAKTLKLPHNFVELPATLEAYESAIVGRGHVGTRLHGGVRALQLGSPSLVLSVDHRATIIGGDTGLPTVVRGTSVRDALSEYVDASRPELLRLPLAEARAWTSNLLKRVGLSE